MANKYLIIYLLFYKAYKGKSLTGRWAQGTSMDAKVILLLCKLLFMDKSLNLARRMQKTRTNRTDGYGKIGMVGQAAAGLKEMANKVKDALD